MGSALHPRSRKARTPSNPASFLQLLWQRTQTGASTQHIYLLTVLNVGRMDMANGGGALLRAVASPGGAFCSFSSCVLWLRCHLQL